LVSEQGVLEALFRAWTDIESGDSLPLGVLSADDRVTEVFLQNAIRDAVLEEDLQVCHASPRR